MSARFLTERSLRSATRRLTAQDSDLAAIVSVYGPPPLSAREPGFPTLIHIILEQQVSLASARAAYHRLVSATGQLAPERFLALRDGELKTHRLQSAEDRVRPRPRRSYPRRQTRSCADRDPRRCRGEGSVDSGQGNRIVDGGHLPDDGLAAPRYLAERRPGARRRSSARQTPAQEANTRTTPEDRGGLAPVASRRREDSVALLPEQPSAERLPSTVLSLLLFRAPVATVRQRQGRSFAPHSLPSRPGGKSTSCRLRPFAASCQLLAVFPCLCLIPCHPTCGILHPFHAVVEPTNDRGLSAGLSTPRHPVGAGDFLARHGHRCPGGRRASALRPAHDYSHPAARSGVDPDGAGQRCGAPSGAAAAPVWLLPPEIALPAVGLRWAVTVRPTAARGIRVLDVNPDGLVVAALGSWPCRSRRRVAGATRRAV